MSPWSVLDNVFSALKAVRCNTHVLLLFLQETSPITEQHLSVQIQTKIYVVPFSETSFYTISELLPFGCGWRRNYEQLKAWNDQRYIKMFIKYVLGIQIMQKTRREITKTKTDRWSSEWPSFKRASPFIHPKKEWSWF